MMMMMLTMVHVYCIYYFFNSTCQGPMRVKSAILLDWIGLDWIGLDIEERKPIVD